MNFRWTAALLIAVNAAYAQTSGEWAAPETIVSSTTGVAPRLKFMPDGLPLALWSTHDEMGAATIWNSRLTGDGSWEAPRAVTEPGSGGGLQDFVVAPDGRGIAVWTGTENGSGYEAVWGLTRSADGQWSEVALISNAANSAAFSPHAALHPDGGAIVAWSQRDAGGTDNIWASRRGATGGWSVPLQISPAASGNAGRPRVTALLGGKAVAVWVQSAAVPIQFHRIWSSRFDPATGWSAPEAVSAGALLGTAVNAGVDASGAIHAVWGERLANNESYLWWNRCTPATGWGSPTQLAPSTINRVPVIAVDAGGNAVVAWTQGYLWPDQVWGREYVSGSGWQPAFQADAGLAGAPSDPLVAASGGRATVMWLKSGLGGSSLYVSRKEAGTSWRPAELLMTTGNMTSMSSLDLAMSSSGARVAGWLARSSESMEGMATYMGIDFATPAGPAPQASGNSGHSCLHAGVFMGASFAWLSVTALIAGAARARGR